MGLHWRTEGLLHCHFSSSEESVWLRITFWEAVWNNLVKLKIHTFWNPAIPFRWMRNHSHAHQETYLRMFIVPKREERLGNHLNARQKESRWMNCPKGNNNNAFCSTLWPNWLNFLMLPTCARCILFACDCVVFECWTYWDG